MIDGVKIAFYSKTIVKDLMSLGVKVLTPVEIEAGGIIHFPKKAIYNGLWFKISESNRVEIRGSLHKYWKGDNHSNFTFKELYECIADLNFKFNLNALRARLSSFEFGVNTYPLFSPFEFCENVIAYKDESFSKFDTKSREIGFNARQQQYIVKVYDKGKEYLKEDKIFRFEIKVKRMNFIQKKVNIMYLADLVNQEVLNRLGELLSEMFEGCIISDKVNSDNLTVKELNIYTICSNPKVWKKFDFRERYRKTRQFERIIETHGIYKWKETTARMIREKWNLLYSLKPKSVENLTDQLKEQKGEINCLDKGLIYLTTDLGKKD